MEIVAYIVKLKPPALSTYNYLYISKFTRYITTAYLTQPPIIPRFNKYLSFIEVNVSFSMCTALPGKVAFYRQSQSSNSLYM